MKLAVCIADALFVPEEHELGGGVALKPMALSKLVRRFESITIVV